MVILQLCYFFTRSILTCRGIDYALANGEIPAKAKDFPKLMKQVISIFHCVVWRVLGIRKIFCCVLLVAMLVGCRHLLFIFLADLSTKE